MEGIGRVFRGTEYIVYELIQTSNKSEQRFSLFNCVSVKIFEFDAFN